MQCIRPALLFALYDFTIRRESAVQQFAVKLADRWNITCTQLISSESDLGIETKERRTVKCESCGHLGGEYLFGTRSACEDPAVDRGNQ